MLNSVPRRWLYFLDAIDPSIMILLWFKDCDNYRKGI